MPPRPFPAGFSIGTDIVNVARIHKLVIRNSVDNQPSQRHDAFLRRFLTPLERCLYRKRFPNEPEEVAQHLAGRWAAKEAAIKAVAPWRRLRAHEVLVLQAKNGRGVYGLILDRAQSAFRSEGASAPAVNERIMEFLKADGDAWGSKSMTDEVEREVTEEMARLQGQVARISISHDGEYATAVCLAVEEPREGDVGGEAAAREIE